MFSLQNLSMPNCPTQIGQHMDVTPSKKEWFEIFILINFKLKHGMSGLKVAAAYCILVFVAILTCFIGEFIWIYGDVPSLAEVLKQKDVYSPNDLYTFRMDDRGNQTKIPSIIHQTWKNMDLSTYPNYNSHFLWSIEYEMRGFSVKLWTDNAIYDLIKTHYPTMEAAFKSLPYDIQRADLARYLILYHEGGYYADLSQMRYQSMILALLVL